MANKRIEKTRGYILIDALLTLFLAGLIFVSAIGVLAIITRATARAHNITRRQIEERNVHEEERKITFVYE